MKRLSFLLLLSLLAASTALAGEVLIPAVYRGGGDQGTLWRTEIVLSNISSHHPFPVMTTITLFRENAEPLEVSMPLSPMEVIDVHDAIHEWFSLENAGGIVRVSWNEENARIHARARVYNANATGEYGQAIPGSDAAALKTEHYLSGLSGMFGNRTNIGVSNPHDVEVLFWVVLHDTSGEARGAFRTAVPPRAFRQFNDIFQYFQAGPLHAAMVRISAATLPVYAYASIVRNDTGDATFVISP